MLGHDPLGAVSSFDVADLVAEHRRELGLVAGDLEHTGVDAHASAGERGGIRLLTLEHDEFPVAIGRLARLHDASADLRHVSLQLWIVRDRSLAADLPKRLTAELGLCFRRHQQPADAPR
jgi:hypothetical protein